VLRLRFIMRAGLAAALVCLLGGASPLAAQGKSPITAGRAGIQGVIPAPATAGHPKLDRALNERATKGGKSQVIVTLHPGWTASGRSEMARLGGKLGRALPILNGQVVELSNGQLKQLANHPAVARIDWDRPTTGEMARAATAVGARAVRQQYGYTGAGIGVAVIDSGIAGWHARSTRVERPDADQGLEGLRQRAYEPVR
jgi:subtilisin family serine protease